MFTTTTMARFAFCALLLLFPLGCSSNSDAAAPFAPSGGPDAVVEGCNEGQPDEIGVRELTGNLGDTIDVPVTVNGTAPIDAFGLDLEFPENVLEFVSVAEGDLTSGWLALAGQSNAPGSVTIGGFHTTEIPAGTFGQLAIVTFRVVGTSTAIEEFRTTSFTNDIAAFDACHDVHAPSPVVESSFGSVKAAYRTGR